MGTIEAGISIYTYNRALITGKMTVREAIEHAASLGVKGIEIVDEEHLPDWPNPSAYDLMQLRKFVQSLGMEICAFSAYLPDILRADRRETREELVEQAKKKLAMADLLGIKYVRLSHSASFNEIRAVFEECIPTCKELGKVWCIELHAPLVPQALVDFFKSVNSPFLGMIPDFSCWQTKGLPSETGGAGSFESFRITLPYAVHVHGKAHEFDERGEEPNTPYGELIGMLKESDYEGFVCAEYEGWMMRDEDARVIAKTHVDLIRRYI